MRGRTAVTPRTFCYGNRLTCMSHLTRSAADAQERVAAPYAEDNPSWHRMEIE